MIPTCKHYKVTWVAHFYPGNKDRETGYRPQHWIDIHKNWITDVDYDDFIEKEKTFQDYDDHEAYECVTFDNRFAFLPSKYIFKSIIDSSNNKQETTKYYADKLSAFAEDFANRYDLRLGRGETLTFKGLVDLKDFGFYGDEDWDNWDGEENESDFLIREYVIPAIIEYIGETTYFTHDEQRLLKDYIIKEWQGNRGIYVAGYEVGRED